MIEDTLAYDKFVRSIRLLPEYDGLEIRESLHATQSVEDWSGCRSRSRAERRRKQGHRQNVKTIQKPACFQMGKTLLIHPELMRQLKERVRESMDAWSYSMLTRGRP